MNIHQLEVEFNTDGRTDLTKLILAFRNILNTQLAARISERVSMKFVIGKY